MLALTDPQEAYRRVEFDARIAGADGQQLVLVCYEQLVAALGTAIHAERTGDNRRKSRALTRALGALTALELGIAGEDGIAGSLRQFYRASRRALLDNVLSFDRAQIEQMRQDFAEIVAAMQS